MTCCAIVASTMIPQPIHVALWRRRAVTAERILAKNGYRVIKAGNGREAIAAIGRFSERIDMLVTDVVMPGMNGSELADRIAVMRPGVKVLFVSGYTQDAIGNKGVIGDEIAFLEKPFAPDALLRKVREVLDG
jgi:DNA-binding NtrC family response regulator